MPRPRAAECTPETRGRVRTTDAAASGSRRALGAAVKNLQATSLSLDLVQRPCRDGASRDRSECCETCSRWGRYACGLNLDDGVPGLQTAMAPRRRRGGSRGPPPACWRGIWPAVAVLDDSVDTSALRRIAPRCCCARRLFAHVVELGGLERLACTPIVARSNCGRNGITWRDIKKSFRAPRRILPIYAGENE